MEQVSIIRTSPKNNWVNVILFYPYSSTRELSKMPITDPVGVQPLPEEIYGKPLYFSNFNKHLSKDILRQVLWLVGNKFSR